VSATGEHPAATSQPSLPEVLDDRTRRTLGDVRLLLAAVGFVIVTVFGGGWVALAQVRQTAKDEAAETSKALDTRVSAVEEQQKATAADVKDLKDEVRGLRKDLRRLFPALPPMDGGQ